MIARKLAKIERAEAKFVFQRWKKNTLYFFHGPKPCLILQFRYSSMFSTFNLVHIVLFYILKHTLKKWCIFEAGRTMAAFNLASKMATKFSFQVYRVHCSRNIFQFFLQLIQSRFSREKIKYEREKLPAWNWAAVRIVSLEFYN